MKARTKSVAQQSLVCEWTSNPYGEVTLARPRASADYEGPALFERFLSRDNLAQAWQRVRSNKGAPGVDGLSIADFPDHTRSHWSKILAMLRSGTYRPQPVRRVLIPKSGGGTRPLGIPTVLDRLIQQALAQVLVPIFDPQFHPHSYGFRPQRSAHDAVLRINAGIVDEKLSWAVDIDLSQFFDRVDHDLLMNRVARLVPDQRILRLIGHLLRSGVLDAGCYTATVAGVPQGGPLSPLLANIMLDDLDQEIAHRGHWHARYADDFIILTKSEAAAQRVLRSIRRYIERRLKLQVNETKSRVVRASHATFLGFTFHRRQVRWTDKTLSDFKHRVRSLTGRSRGISFQRRVQELNRYVRGWMGYFRLSRYYRPLEGLDDWIRRRLRMCMWKHWRYARTRVRTLIAMGAPKTHAIKAGSSNKSCWRLAKTLASNAAMNLTWFDQQGVLSIRKLWIDFHYPNG